MKRWSLVTMACGLALGGLLLAGCGSGTGVATASRLLFLHFSPDTGDLRIRRDGVLIGPLSGTGNGVVATGSASLPVAVNAESAHYTGTLNGGQVVFDDALKVAAREFLIYLGKRQPANGEPAAELRSVPFSDELPAGTEAGSQGTGGVRFFHAATGAGTVSLVKPITDAEPMALAEGLTFGQISGLTDGVTQPIQVPVEVAPCRLEVRDADGQLVAFVIHTFDAGQVLNLALIDGENRPTLLQF